MNAVARCSWADGDPLMQAYHDREWGVPEHDDRRLFELLVLESQQAGLSWMTILRKREGYRVAFARFDPESVARFGPADVERLLADPGIVRHRGKIEATVANARAALRIVEEFGSLNAYLWQLVGGRPVVNRFATLAEIPPQTPEAAAMSRDLRRRGFRFLGPTTCYAFMQAAGMVNDHLVGCFRHAEVSDARQQPCD